MAASTFSSEFSSAGLRAVLLAGLLVSACDGDDQVSDASVSTDSGLDAGASDGATGDTGIPEAPCTTLRDGAFDIDSGGRATQIQAAAASANGIIWVAYSAPLPDNNFEVRITGIGCDGAVIVPSIALSQPGSNQLEPTIALGATRILVVWQRDTAGASPNLDIPYQMLDLDGRPVFAEPRVLSFSGNEVGATGNAWMPSAAAHNDGFLVAGALGHDRAPAFQLFVQGLDRDGESVGATRIISPDATASQINPSVAVARDGARATVAWESQKIGSDSEVFYSETDLSAGSWTASTAVSGEAVRPAVSYDGQGGARVAWTVPGVNMRVLDVTRGGVANFGDVNRIDHTPKLAFNVNQTGMVHHQIAGGGIRDLIFRGLDANLNEQSRITFDTGGRVAPYDTVLIPVAELGFFTAWSEGTSPNFVLRGSFITP